MLTYVLVSVSGLFLTPFVLNRLGPSSFATYALSATVGTFVAILDFGLGISAMKMIAERYDQKDPKAVSELVSSVFGAYVVIGFIVTACGLAVSPFAASAFHVSAADAGEFRTCFILGAVTVGLVFPQAIFTATLNGNRDYATNNLFVLGFTVASLTGTVCLLNEGHGVIALFVWSLVLGISQFAIKAIVVNLRHQVRVRIRLISTQVLRGVAPLAGWVLIINIGTKLILDLDVVIAGLVIGPIAIAACQVATSIAMVIRRAAEQLNVVTLTVSAGLWSQRDLRRLRTLFVEVNRVTAIIMFPAFALTALAGPRFLNLWVGEDIGQRASGPLVALAAAMVVIAVQASSAQILVAMGLHRVVAITTLAEAAANLVLSFALAETIGIIGIAIGTLVPSILTTLIIFTRLSSRSIGVPLKSLARALLPITAQSGAMIIAGKLLAQDYVASLSMIRLVSLSAIIFVCWIGLNIFVAPKSRKRYAQVLRSRRRGITIS